ncbi:aminotransferase class I/II-fold pyridoxal phosphate-dependent enzyme [Actinacidiphila rubida]|uniref:PAS domain S-box-containing protein/diguanylate cyclase (GGDEF) domain-containing protein n=1 Tax=Actinacidiphila rubida TaxID=310780 RepID=A0A1H8SRP0_9ACTN|nr:aminotransferase class I/II-fold pyridoxal phosphate-dependent enzyme [Actinacidiphila rubida]SEO81629.1 PAS domain S-box-containing protein/diguanylate cyclase (GGDEF) domain-containing protein [Actinacidiphila rubida]
MAAAYVIVVAAVTVVYLTVPRLHIGTWAVIGFGSSAAIVVGIRSHRPAHAWPWYMLAAANFTFTAGDTTYNVLNRFFGEQNPFPSPADAFYLMTYPLFAAGMLGFVRYRSSGRDRGALLDSLILTTGLALLFWTWLIDPNTTADGMTWVQKAISIAYPLGDILILAMLARLLTPGTLRSPAVRLLTLGTLGLLVSDVLYGLLQLAGTWRVGTPMDLGWVVFFTAWGLSALHPSMVELTERAPARPPGMRRPLLAVLVLASLLAPGVLLYEALRGQVVDALEIAVFSAVLFLLVMGRLSGLVATHRKALATERGLQAAAASLVSAASVKDIAQTVEDAGRALFDPAERHDAVLLTSGSAGAELRAVGTRSRHWHWGIGRRDSAAAGWSQAMADRRSQMLAPEEVSPSAAAELGDVPSVLLCPLAVQDGPAHDTSGPHGATADGAVPAGTLAVTGTREELAERWGACEVLASQAALALHRVALGQEVARRNSEAYFRTLVHNASDVILILDDDDTVRYASPSAEAVFGRQELEGAPLAGFLAPQDRVRALRALAGMRAEGSSDSRDDWRMIRPGGDRIDVEVRCSNLRHDRTVEGLVLTLRDVTEQRQLERELTRRAFHDSLTGLPNRVLLLERTERALLRGARDSTVTCVLFVDLDDFKLVNDTRGHAVGDELLISVARRLTATLRASDTAARLGGDEFAVLMEGARDPREAEVLAAQLVHSLSRPYRLSAGTLEVSASVGIASTRDSRSAEDLLGHSDVALYAAKTAGKRQWRQYRPGLGTEGTGIVGAPAPRDELRDELAGVVGTDGLRLHYQPIVRIDSGEVAGFEALVRWRHDRRGLLAPDQFITLAEETGHIRPLGSWVLQHAAAHTARWQRLLARPDPLRVNVNVSASQFRDPSFVDEVRRVLDSSGLALGSLVLELTETVLMHHDQEILSTMDTLRDLGVTMAIDDFGTGFSPLNYLREFPVDIIKVDKSFIQDIVSDGRQVALVEGIVRIADTLGLQVIAEGIEHEVQRDRLVDMGCRFGQGYLFAHPMPADEGDQLVRAIRDQGAPPADGTAAARRQDGDPIRPVRPRRRHGGSGPGTEEVRMRAVQDTGDGSPPEARWRDLDRLRESSPMSDAVIDEVRGRHIRSGGRWLIDFASCNYLGLDLDTEVMAAIGPQVRRWGTHPSWSRLIGSPRLYPEIEERLTSLLGAPDTLLLPTISLIHASVIPVLADGGHVFVEAHAHRTVFDGCRIARGHGATVRRFHAGRPDELGALLDAVPAGEMRMVCLDGADSMTGNLPDLPRLAAVCRERGALLYVDDAHGFGVLGERQADETSPYGSRGNGIVRHFGESYDNVVLVAGFSKAYSSLLAFLALPTRMKNHLKVAAAPYLYSGPSPTASLATALAGLEVNDRRGDAIRAGLYAKTVRVLDELARLGVGTPSTDGLPIIEIPLADAGDLEAVAAFLWEQGIYVTLAPYPLVPRDRVGVRLQITAANTDDDIGRLNASLGALAGAFALRPRT